MKERSIPPIIQSAVSNPQRIHTFKEYGIKETLFASSAVADIQGETAFQYGLKEYLEMAKVAIANAQRRTNYPGRGVLSRVEELLDSSLSQVPIARRLEVANMLGRHIMGLYAGIGFPHYNHALVLGPGPHFGELLNLRLHEPDRKVSFIEKHYKKWLLESGKLLQIVSSERQAAEVLEELEKLDLMRGLADNTISGSFAQVDRLTEDIPPLSGVDLVIARHPQVIGVPESLKGLAEWAHRMQSRGGAYLFTHYTQDEMLLCGGALRSRGLTPLIGKNSHTFAAWYVEEEGVNRSYTNICDGFVVTNIPDTFSLHSNMPEGSIYTGR